MNGRLPEDGFVARIAGRVDALAAWLAQHWLAVFNLIVAVFVGLPFLAPALAEYGATGAANVIYKVYAPTCHQLPERSFFLFGPRIVYDVPELEAYGVLPPELNILQRQATRFDGAPVVGYKVAICERDIGIYGSILLSGLLFALIRGPLAGGQLRRGRRFKRKMPLWLFVVLLLPMAIDGGTQLVGWRESTWLLRLVTGGLFGAAVVWLAYPYVQEAMDDVLSGSKRDHPASIIPETGQNAPPAV